MRLPFRSGSSGSRFAKLIVGLGNPGKEYADTRHNVGFQAIDLLAQRHGVSLKKHRHQAVFGDGRIDGVAVLLAKPLTFMNLSGNAVASLCRYHAIDPADVLVIVDDVNLPLGRLRIRASGSAGGHNGLKSIIGSLGTNEYPRIRIGVGAPDGRPLVDHVLGRFGRRESEIVTEILQVTAEAVEVIVRDGVEAAMNRFNAYGTAAPDPPERGADAP